MAREYLEDHGIAVNETLDARKNPLDDITAWKIVQDAEAIYAVRGKKTNNWTEIEDNKNEILNEIIGRSGNLRAPTLKIGNVFVVGFQKEIYDTLFSK